MKNVVFAAKLAIQRISLIALSSGRDYKYRSCKVTHFMHQVGMFWWEKCGFWGSVSYSVSYSPGIANSAQKWMIS